VLVYPFHKCFHDDNPIHMTETVLGVVDQISKDPFRGSTIHRLRLDLDLYDLLGPTLHELDIRVRPKSNWWLDCHDQHLRTDLKGRQYVKTRYVEEDYIYAVIRHWETVLRGVEEFPHLTRLSIYGDCSIEIHLRFLLRRAPQLKALHISGRVVDIDRFALELPDLPDSLPHLKSLRTVPYVPGLNTQLLLASKQSIEEVRGVGDLQHVSEDFSSLRRLAMRGAPKTPNEWSKHWQKLARAADSRSCWICRARTFQRA
jgi:hypothetical protein